MKKLLFILLFSPLLVIGQSNYDSLFVEYSNSKTDTGKMELAYKLGVHFHYLNLDSAQHYFGSMLAIAQKKGDLKKESLAMSSLGIIDLGRGDFEMALKKNLKSLEISSGINDAYGVARANINLGIANMNMGRYQTSMGYFIQSVKITEAKLSKNPENEADLLSLSRSYGNIGNLHAYLGENGSGEASRVEYEKAIAILKKSIPLKDKLISSTDPSMQSAGGKDKSITYSNLGEIYYLLQEYDSAMKYTDAAMALYKEFDYPTGIPFCLSNLGKINAAKEYYGKSIANFKEAIETFDKLGFSAQLGESYGSLASVYRDYANTETTTKNNKTTYLKEALFFGLKGYALSIENTSVSTQKNIALTLKEIYEILGNEKEALKFANIYMAVNDSLFSNNKIRALEDLEAKYQNELNQSKLERQTLELEKKALIIAKKEKENMLWICAFIAILLLAAIVVRQKYAKSIQEREAHINEINLLKQRVMAKIIAEKRAINEDSLIMLDKAKIEATIDGNLNETDWKILNLCYQNPVISNKELADQVLRSLDGTSSSLRKMYRLFDIQGVKNKKVALVMLATKISNDI
ncbi:MAG: tetratricopeptide repeat protein [Vicingaceae bacterium]|nr:tetratricopeptide repeat protein [Vicingaceae bacterium]